MTALDMDRRKAFDQLRLLGFRILPVAGAAEVKIVAPDGAPLGKFSLAKRNRSTPQRLRARLRQWERGTRGGNGAEWRGSLRYGTVPS